MAIYLRKNVIKYDELYQKGHDHEYPNLDLVRLAAAYFKVKNTKVLDYGFGTGENLIHLFKKGYKVYGAEASIEAIRLVKRKIKKRNLPNKKISLIKLNEDDDKIPFEDNFFDNIICTSVLSLLRSKENVIQLINEFHRVLKIEGKLIIDINGPDSAFKIKGKFISEDMYQSQIKNGENISTYCPRSLKVFSKLFGKFHLDELGEVKFKYFRFLEHEYIACLRKKA
tara:strand:+ start:493 stop:1170 length:678 start_codon:yes stop_codon:yes gene_type:complete